jgi:UDP-glucose 4-epimerase
LNDERPVVFGDGEQTRDFIFVEDAVKANLLAAINDDIVGSEYNVASGQKYSLNQLLETLKEIIGTDIEPDYADSRPGDIHHSCADISKLKSHGFSPEIDLRQGLEQTIDYFKSQRSSPKLLSKLNR